MTNVRRIGLLLLPASVIAFAIAPLTPEVASEPESTTVGVTVVPDQIICQKLADRESTCVPTCVLNALRCGPKTHRAAFEKIPGKSDKERLIHTVETYGKLPSVVEKRNLLDENGVLMDDITAFMNAVLKDGGAETVQGALLDRREGESWNEFLTRIHGKLMRSLSAGVPVVVSVQSIGATFQVDKFLWKALAGHAIVITRVPRKLSPYQQGFAFEYVEPFKGSICEGYLFAEEVRGFQAFERDGKVTPRWRDNAFLHVTSPSLFLDTQKQAWFTRTFMTFHYGVGKFE